MPIRLAEGNEQTRIGQWINMDSDWMDVGKDNGLIWISHVKWYLMMDYTLLDTLSDNRGG